MYKGWKFLKQMFVEKGLNCMLVADGDEHTKFFTNFAWLQQDLIILHSQKCTSTSNCYLHEIYSHFEVNRKCYG